jgi:endonuclease/exonuclease/phosphatase (EEP) superfamily protein YafD
VTAWDSRSVLVALNALTPLLYVPAWAVAVAAGATRNGVLLAAALVVVAAHVAFVAPEVVAHEPLPALTPTTPRLRLVTANVYGGNAAPGRDADEIRDGAPDVVLLQEATPRIIAALDATGALEGLPHRAVVPRTDHFAALFASRQPLLDQDVVEVDGRPVIVRATIDVAGTVVRVYSVHAIAPFEGHREAWERDLRAVAAAVRAERLPVVVAGDFNATWGHREFRRLLEAGLTDAAAARGHPFQMTWPRDRRVVPPVARIDHVLTTKGLTVVSVRSGRGLGSDHRPLLAEVAVGSAAPSG